METVKRRKLSISARAKRDLIDIRNFVAVDSPTAAKNQIGRILMHADVLRDQPFLGRDRSPLSPNLRSIVERPYTIFYYPQDDEIEIVRILANRRDIEPELRTFLRTHFKKN